MNLVGRSTAVNSASRADALNVIAITALLMLACNTTPIKDTSAAILTQCSNGDDIRLDLTVGFDFSVFPVGYLEPVPLSGMAGVLVPTAWQFLRIQSTEATSGAPVVIDGSELQWTQSESVRLGIEALHPAPTGKRWVGFASNAFTHLPSNGPFSVRSRIEFLDVSPSDGSALGFFLGDSENRVSIFGDLAESGACSQSSLPSISKWGLVVLALALLVSAYLTRRVVVERF